MINFIIFMDEIALPDSGSGLQPPAPDLYFYA